MGEGLRVLHVGAELMGTLCRGGAKGTSCGGVAEDTSYGTTTPPVGYMQMIFQKTLIIN